MKNGDWYRKVNRGKTERGIATEETGRGVRESRRRAASAAARLSFVQTVVVR